MGVLDKLAKAASRLRPGDVPAPYTHVGWHGTPGHWPREKPQINLDLGEGFGFHVGTRDAAVERLAGHMDGRMLPTMNSTIVDIAALPGRALDMEDIGNWGVRGNWLQALEDGSPRYAENGKWVSLSKEEIEALELKLRQAGGRKTGRTMRSALLDLGFDRVRYINHGEDFGSTSYAMLDPTKLRWGSRAGFNEKRKGENNLLAGLAGAAPVGVMAALARRRERADA